MSGWSRIRAVPVPVPPAPWPASARFDSSSNGSILKHRERTSAHDTCDVCGLVNEGDPSGRIHWAETESAKVWCGYMDGAISAGARAANEVVEALHAR